jgi:prolyl-tRNA editing enzyme YbaK/EbsC (Cys-tRNA(Pro) deacylase)
MTDLVAKLKSRNVPFELIEYDEELFTTEAVALAAKLPIHRVAKAMLLRIRNNYRIALVPGNTKVDLAALTARWGTAVRFADRNQAAIITGVPVGAVTPLVALARPHIRVIMDETLLTEQAINISSGVLTMGVNVSPRALQVAVEAEVARIAA